MRKYTKVQPLSVTPGHHFRYDVPRPISVLPSGDQATPELLQTQPQVLHVGEIEAIVLGHVTCQALQRQSGMWGDFARSAWLLQCATSPIGEAQELLRTHGFLSPTLRQTGYSWICSEPILEEGIPAVTPTGARLAKWLCPRYRVRFIDFS